MKNIKYLITLSLLLAKFVHANEVTDFLLNQCPKVSNHINLVYLWNNKTENNDRCEIISDYSKAIQSISQFVELPTAINISLYDIQVGASFSPPSNILTIANKLQTMNSTTKEKFLRSKKANLITFVHEYGHAIFAEWLKNELPEYEEFCRKQKQNSLALTELYFYSDRRSTLEFKLKKLESNGKMGSVEYSKLKKEYETIGRALAMSFSLNNSNTSGDAQSFRINSSISAYAELFADLVAILFANDPKAMAFAISYPSMNQVDQVLVNGRDFSIVQEVESWSSLVGHILLTPSRGYIYNKFLRQNISPIEKRKLLKDIFNALKNEIEQKWGEISESPARDNEDLIERLRRI